MLLPYRSPITDLRPPLSLLSKFAVTTDGVRTLKIKSAVLEGVDGAVVKSCRSASAPTLVSTNELHRATQHSLQACMGQTLLPLQSANFLFKIMQNQSLETKGEPALNGGLAATATHRF